jgi:hypothetical protein
MAIRTARSSLCFLDTSYAIALISPNDEQHRNAVRLSLELEKSGARIITTEAVLFEVANALAKPKYRRAAIELLESLEGGDEVEIVALTNRLYRLAFQLFKSRLDKSWGLTDCLSFVVMGERKITDALTADEHFEQAGFRPLLRK